MASKELIQKILRTLLTTYPTQARSDEDKTILFGVWLDVLGSDDISDDMLRAATEEYKRSPAEFLPPPGKLYTRVLELSNGDSEERALTAWDKFREWDYGHYGESLNDPLALLILRRLGGVEHIGNMDSDKVNNFARREFVKMYAEQCGRDQARIAATSKRLGERTAKGLLK